MSRRTKTREFYWANWANSRLAEAALATAIKLAPQRTRSHFHLTLLRRTPAGDPHLAIMEHLARRIDSLTPSEQIDLNFALAKAYEDSGDSERSFRRLVAGNALKRKTFVYHEDSTLRVLQTADQDVYG